MTLPFPVGTLEWWVAVAGLTAVGVSVLWWLCSHSLLLQQVIWPPIIEGGHHTSKRWTAEKNARYKTNPHSRCVICGCQGEKTWHLFSVRRKGWRWQIIAARSTSKALHLHETLYSYVRGKTHLPRRYGWMMCPTHHSALHAFDKWLLPWDRRNRFLWFTSLVYLAGWYLLYLVTVGAPAAVALYVFKPELAHRIVGTVTQAIR